MVVLKLKSMLLVLATMKLGIKAINLRRVMIIKYQISEKFRNKARDIGPKHFDALALEIQQKVELLLLVIVSLRAAYRRERLGRYQVSFVA